MVKRLTLILFLVLIVVALAGCGSKKKKAEATVINTTPTTSVGTTGSQGATGGTGSDTTSTGSVVLPGTAWAAGSKKCTQFIALWSQLGQEIQAIQSGSSSSSSFSSDMQKFDQIAAGAPAQVKADFQTVRDGYQSLADRLASIGLKSGQTPTPTQIPKLIQAYQAIASSDFSSALNRISTWETNACIQH